MSDFSAQTAAHVLPQTELWFRSYPAEQRVTFHIGPGGNDVVLFLDLVDIDRVCDVLDEARKSLQAPALKVAA